MDEEKKENLTENSQVDPVEDLVEEIKEDEAKEEEAKSDVVLEPVPSEATVEVDENAVVPEESVAEAPAVETPVVEEAPAVEETPTEPVVEETPAVEETPTETATVVEEAPAVEETPAPAEPTPEVTETPATEATQPEAKKKSMLPVLLVIIVVLAIAAVVVLVVKPFDKKESTTKEPESAEKKDDNSNKPASGDPSSSAEAMAQAAVDAYSQKNAKKLVSLLHPDYVKATEEQMKNEDGSQSMTLEQAFEMVFALIESISFADNPTATELTATEIAAIKTELTAINVNFDITAASKYTYTATVSAMGSANVGKEEVTVIKVADKWYLYELSDEEEAS